MKNFINKLFGSHSDRELKRLKPIVDKINSLEPELQTLSDDELRAKTEEFKKRYKNGESLDDMLPEAFAVVREGSRRILGMRHFDVQLLGGIVLHQGRIAEMKTGEGKTLVATLPAYLNAITGEGVHIVTVNDYLAKRDSEWMGKLYTFLGLKVGLIVHDLTGEQRREAYAADITYVTNNELGFDYLRDNMVIYKKDMVQRGHNFAIVDEVDSILIDEARTPLIISGAGNQSTDLYKIVDGFARTLKALVIKESDDKEDMDDVEADYIVDEKAKSVILTARGVSKAESYFGIENLSDPDNIKLSHHINQAIRAYGIMHRDKDYMVKDGQVLIVDEFTGRLMQGRRYSDGLHQAIEAKENVKVERESMTLATITFQNFFRLYKKLSGMTGTALTEEEEFRAIYNLDVVEIPTNKPVQRKDLTDVVYKNTNGKLNAIVNQILECHEKGQPVLVGTITIDKSEQLSALLKRRGIKHEVLNAKFHEKEAQIIAQAGKAGAVTIATNMAGRGTDIMLGGNAEYMAKEKMAKMGYDEELIVEADGYGATDDEDILEARKTYKELYEKYKEEISGEREQVIKAGGLFILGTERHESRRIDNQLRGRSGRQGDVGASRFFISLEDDLMRIFGAERIQTMVEALKLEEDQPIEAKMLSNAIENAQKRVEARNFDIRKNVLQYDDVMNQQREVIYKQRQTVLENADVRGNIFAMIPDAIDNVTSEIANGMQFADEWNWSVYEPKMLDSFGVIIPLTEQQKNSFTKQEFDEFLLERLTDVYNAREEEIGSENMRELERIVLLRVVDQKWMDHIDCMDQLRQGIGLNAYAQRNPVDVYKDEGSAMFEQMVHEIKLETVRLIYRARLNIEQKREQVAKPIVASHGDEEVKKKPVKAGEKIGRNDPCPCGSGLKYKKCCGK